MKPQLPSLRMPSDRLFSNPHHPAPAASQLSPLPEKPPIDHSTTSSPSATGSHTPLLPPTPSKDLEASSSYPFRTADRSGGIWKRMRMMFGTAGWRGSGTARRVLFLGLLLALATVVYRRSTLTYDYLLPSSSSSSSYISTPSAHPPPSGYEDDSDSPPGGYPPSRYTTGKGKFRLPLIPFPFSSSSSDSVNPPKDGRREIDVSSDPLPVEATLHERLDAWRNAPGGRGEVEGEIELGGFVSWNLESCSTISEQHNTHMIQHSANYWASMNRTTLHEHRMELINYMEDEVLAKKLHERHGEGRGIVMVAGNADTLQRVKWTLEMLRSYGSELPVQIYHFPSERPPDDDSIREDLARLGAELVEATGQERDKGKNKSYHLKAIAVVQCPWREVLYLDSDSIPTRDPDYMFDSPNYRRLGIWATPDYWKTSANNPIWAIMGVRCRDEWEMETGQMFIDKQRHLDVFYLVKYMLERHTKWFNFSDGDKDIFRWALLALRKRWGVPGRWVGAAALPSGTASGDFCAHTMLQHDSWGEPLFVHYNLLKQIPSGVGRGFSWGRTKQLPLFNTWPATPATARGGEPEEQPDDGDRPGLGDEDCDMLADADDTGRARAPAKEMVMRRAARERGVKVRYHGGWISALCIDLDYIDPRAKEVVEAEAEERTRELYEKSRVEQEWKAAVEVAEAEGATPPPMPDILRDDDAEEGEGEGQEGGERKKKGAVKADWGQSPIEVVSWSNDENLRDFERKIYDLGFKPSGPGF